MESTARVSTATIEVVSPLRFGVGPDAVCLHEAMAKTSIRAKNNFFILIWVVCFCVPSGDFLYIRAENGNIPEPVKR